MDLATRRRAVQALRDIVDDGGLATRVVPALLRDAADDAERRWLKDVVYGAAVLRLRLRHRFGDDVERWVDAVAPADGADDDDDGAWPADPVERLVVRRSCPRWLVERLIASLGVDGADGFLAASNRPGPVTLRCNTLKNDRETLRALLVGKGVDVDDAAVVSLSALSPWALGVRGKLNLTALASWRAARFEVQDAGSQHITLRTGAAAGDVVVDLCAGRGGKTLALAAMMEDRGALFVHDVDDRALADLRGRVRRAGLSCVRPGLPGEGSADVVLVDAPCSSTGVLRRSPDLRFTLRQADVDAVVVVQTRLLKQAALLARPGGRVVYATCSVLHDENAAVVDAALAGSCDGLLEEESRRTLLPHVEGCDGFFVSVLRRT